MPCSGHAREKFGGPRQASNGSGMSDRPPARARGRPRAEPASDTAGVRIKALDRGLALLERVAEEGAATLKVLAAASDMAPSTAHRVLETLRCRGLVDFDAAAQTWSIGVEAFCIGHAYARRSDYLEAGRQAMRELTDQTGETSNIAVIERHDVVHVSQVETRAPIRAFLPPGTRGLPQASGIGKALLAHMPPERAERMLGDQPWPRFTANTITSASALHAALDGIRRRGWAVDDEERHPGMRCIAAPIFNVFEEAIAGLSVSGPTARIDDAAIEPLGHAVHAAAARVTAHIGGRRPSSG